MAQYQYTIYTDGSVNKNPGGAGGWGAVIINNVNHTYREIQGGDPKTTNNRMEMSAAIYAISSTPEGCYIEIFTDSQYLKKALTNGWLEKWKKNGWMTTAKTPVLNQDLWEELDRLGQSRFIDFNWVKGHAGNRLNERCDYLAKEACEQYAKLNRR